MSQRQHLEEASDGCYLMFSRVIAAGVDYEFVQLVKPIDNSDKVYFTSYETTETTIL